MFVSLKDHAHHRRPRPSSTRHAHVGFSHSRMSSLSPLTNRVSSDYRMVLTKKCYVDMKKDGFFGIGIEHPKTKVNYWTLFRTAQIYNADFLFLVGARFSKGSPDTMKAFRHVPVYSYKDIEDFNDHRPYGCLLVGVEMTDEAVALKDFNHPKQGAYLLGAEDHGLSKRALELCQKVVKLPGEQSLNVSVAGSIILYDRLVKEG